MQHIILDTDPGVDDDPDARPNSPVDILIVKLLKYFRDNLLSFLLEEIIPEK